jgi:hypothetical protein
MSQHSERWDESEREPDFIRNGENMTVLEIMYAIRWHVRRSSRYDEKTKRGLLRASERDIEKIAGV